MSVFKTIGDGLADFVDWVREQLEDDLIRRSIAEDLGLQPGESVPKANLPQDSLDGITRYRGQANPDKETFIILLNDVRAVYEACRSLIKAFGVSNVTAANELLYRMFDILAANYVRLSSPSAYFLIQALAALTEGSAELDAAISKPADPAVDNPEEREMHEMAFKRFFYLLYRGIVFALSPLYYLFETFDTADESHARRVSDGIFPQLAVLLVILERKDILTARVMHSWDTLEEPARTKAGIKDLAGLVQTMKGRDSAMADFLRTRRGTSAPGTVLQGLINGYTGGVPTLALRQMVLDELNQILDDATFFEKLDELLKKKAQDNSLLFDRIPISTRTRQLAGQRPTGDDLRRLNLSLLKAAFPELVSASSRPLADAISERALTVEFPFTHAPTPGSDIASSISLTFGLIPATHAKASGLLLSVGGKGEMEIDLSPRWKFRLAANAEPAFSIFFDTKLCNITGKSPTDAPLNVALVSVPDENNVTFAIPDAEGTRLEIGQLALSFGFDGTSGQIKAQARRCALVIAGKDQDGFLATFLPADGLRIPFDFGVGYSTKNRFFTEGGVQWPTGAGSGPKPFAAPGPPGGGPGAPIAFAAPPSGLEEVPRLSGTERPELGMQQVIEIGKALLGVRLNHLLLSLAPASDAAAAKATTEVSVSLAIKIGPVTAAVERIGLELGVSFPQSGGNAGFADFSIGFKAPSGVGIKVDSAFVSGGGFLFLDREKGQYAGFLQLTIQETLTVTAIGVITTRLPSGKKGFSFVIMITAQGFKPIPLGLGFTLTGIGGLLAINRTANEEFLREGIKNKTLDDILFPKDPIANAAQIFATLNTAFPPQDESYLFGPVVRICWGTPPILTMDLGLILELGKRNRLVILGRVSAIMPTEKHDLLRLQMNAL
ncbi:MAG TPA: DUF6603 domain-containing protein, partial [Gemmataceae bacterium]|nr:DUF6603 domain-containing protein [Gemmataceae bacterium]